MLFLNSQKIYPTFFFNSLGMILAKCVLQSIVGKYNNNQMGTHVVKQTLRETNYTSTYFALFSSIMHQLTFSLVLNCFLKTNFWNVFQFLTIMIVLTTSKPVLVCSISKMYYFPMHFQNPLKTHEEYFCICNAENCLKSKY